MGNGAATQKRPGPSAGTPSADETTIVPNQDIVGLARLAEAKNKFMKAKEKKEALNAFKQVELVFCVQLYSIICYRLYFILSI